MKTRPLQILLALSSALFLFASTASALTAIWNTPTDIPITAPGYTATGTIDLTLNFAPAVGTNLTVVQNTALSFISGKFSNLSQGQTVILPFGGTDYRFVANYYGGTGNDLVLLWGNSRPVAWGYSGVGQIGDSFNVDRRVPTDVLTNGVLSNKTVIALSTGQSHSLALCSDGTVAAWGSNTSAQLGNNTTINSYVPVAVVQSGALSGKTVVGVYAADRHSVALCSDGTLAAWGGNNYGQLGDNGAEIKSDVPIVVPLGGKKVTVVAVGWAHTVALCSDGTLLAWGYNLSGALGNAAVGTLSKVPVPVDQSGILANKTVIAVGAGFMFSLALCSDGTVATWGDNEYDSLGNDTVLFESHVPVSLIQNGVLAGKTIVSIAAGGTHSLALCSDNTLVAWGENRYGELGIGNTSRMKVPVMVNKSGALTGKTVTAISAGYSHSLALCSDGVLAGWGNNYNGQLGNNSTTSTGVPVTAIAPGETRFAMVGSGSQGSHTMALLASPTNSLPPGTSTSPADSIKYTAATLRGVVNANLKSTTVVFDYGTTTAYGSTVTAVPSPVTGNNPTSVSANVILLDPNTTYHFRARAVSEVGTTTGEDRSFTTLNQLQNWRQKWFGSIDNTGNAADNADPYKTGVRNLLVFGLLGFAQNPQTAQLAQLPQPQVGGGNIFYSFDTPSGASGVVYSAEWTSNLASGTWQVIPDTGAGTHHVFSVPIGTKSQILLRLRVSEP